MWRSVWFALSGGYGVGVPLEGGRMLLLAAALAVAAPSAAALAWNRTPRPLRLRLPARAGLLICVQLTALLFAAVAINDWGQFYGSWGELLGSQHSVVRLVRRGSVSRTPALTVVGHPRLTGALAGDGRLVQVTVNGYRSGLSEPAYVYLPPQYFEPGYRRVRLPAVLALSGYPGALGSQLEPMRYVPDEEALLGAHRIRPMVLVLMRSTVVSNRDTECTDVPLGPQALTFFTEDVPSAIDAAFHTAPDRWGAIGDSTGGYCATKISMMQSGVFRAAVSLSGYYQALRDETTGDLWGASTVLRDLNDLEWRLGNEPVPPVALLLTIGTEETHRYGIPDTQRFLRLVRPPMTARVVYVPGGGHRFSSWNMVLPGALQFLSARLWATTLPG